MNIDMVGNHRTPWRSRALAWAALLGLAAGWSGAAGAETETTATAAPAAASPAPGEARLERDGIIVDFKVRAAGVEGPEAAHLIEGDHAEISLSIRDAVNGEPIQGQYPGVWVDLVKAWNNEQSGGLECKQRVGVYLQGNVGIRPMIDLNSYFVLVMNRDSTISVIDPIVGISGITKLYAQILLKRPGGDWVRSADDKRLYVSVPQLGEVAVINAETFKVVDYWAAGRKPLRVLLQRDEKYVWLAGSGGRREVTSAVAVDVQSGETVADIPIGVGHHEIALSDDDLYLFVTSRNEGTVSVIDTRKLEKVKVIETGKLPVSLTWSGQSQAAYVADGETGQVAVIDGRSLELVRKIETKPGLGPMRTSRDGRWVLVSNSSEDLVYVIDTATDSIRAEIPVKGRPFRIAFSDHFAYVRALDSEKISLINLNELRNPGMPPVVQVPIGDKAPSTAKDVAFTDTMQPAPGEAAMLVVSPGDNTVYYYMEGMNAPMGNFRNYGHRPRAVQVVDRTMREKEPGVYRATVRLPVAGTYDVAMVTETPRIVHCFQMSVNPNTALAQLAGPPEVEFLDLNRFVKVGEQATLRFRLVRKHKNEQVEDVQDVRVLYFRAPGRDRTEVPARQVEPGVYEVKVDAKAAGAYYVHVAAPSEDLRYGDSSFITLIATPTGEGFPQRIGLDKDSRKTQTADDGRG